MKHNIRQLVTKTIDGNSYKTQSVTSIDCELGSGVFDKHGREIFEGDKVKVDGEIYNVTFVDGALGTARIVDNCTVHTALFGNDIEIVGHAED